MYTFNYNLYNFERTVTFNATKKFNEFNEDFNFFILIIFTNYL